MKTFKLAALLVVSGVVVAAHPAAADYHAAVAPMVHGAVSLSGAPIKFPPVPNHPPVPVHNHTTNTWGMFKPKTCSTMWVDAPTGGYSVTTCR